MHSIHSRWCLFYLRKADAVSIIADHFLRPGLRSAQTAIGVGAVKGEGEFLLENIGLCMKKPKKTLILCDNCLFPDFFLGGATFYSFLLLTI